MRFENIGTTELFLLAFVCVVFIVPLWRICTKAGFSGWYSLIVLIPIINLIALFVFAFVRWPVERNTRGI
jgi:uncharacterized membrane protein YhaH (DUF805 family)